MLVGQRCLELMTNPLVQNMAVLEDEATANIEVPDLKEKVKEMLPSELKYTCLIACGGDWRCRWKVPVTTERIHSWVLAQLDGSHELVRRGHARFR